MTKSPITRSTIDLTCYVTHLHKHLKENSQIQDENVVRGALVVQVAQLVPWVLEDQPVQPDLGVPVIQALLELPVGDNNAGFSKSYSIKSFTTLNKTYLNSEGP